MPSAMKWRKREKRNDKEHHEKASVFSYCWVFERFLFCFSFEKTSSSLLMLFVHIGKRLSETLRSSRSQMFFKIGVLKSFSIFAKKHLCSSFFFNKAEGLKACIFIKKVFSCEYCEIFKNSLLVEHFLFIILSCDDRILWMSMGTKLTRFIFLYYCCFPS